MRTFDVSFPVARRLFGGGVLLCAVSWVVAAECSSDTYCGLTRCGGNVQCQCCAKGSGTYECCDGNCNVAGNCPTPPPKGDEPGPIAPGGGGGDT